MTFIANVSTGAVLTGDIVNSTRLPARQEEKLVSVLGLFLKGHLHEFYRGDSFQAYIKKPEEALRLALACRAVALDITEKGEADISGDVRIGIGVGKIDKPVRKIGTAKGTAFVLSGHQLDELQIGREKAGRRLAARNADRRMSISCGEPMADIGFQVMADYLDNIYKGMTGKQAAVIVQLLQGITQQQLTVTLNKSKSTVSQLANAGRWPEIERLLEQYEDLIKLIK